MDAEDRTESSGEAVLWSALNVLVGVISSLLSLRAGVTGIGFESLFDLTMGASVRGKVFLSLAASCSLNHPK